MSSHNDRASKSWHLRVPKALAVALVGTSASLAVSFTGCDVPKEKISIDAAEPRPDAGTDDVPDGMDQNAFADASIDGKPDAAIDARPDVAIDARPDAAIDARPDAPPDARPDAPVV